MDSVLDKHRVASTGLRFIPDQAAERDEFGGSHESLAKAIASVIRASQSLKVIGLLGPWGSGKSTVIRFITSQLADEDDDERMLCFSYDAWLHQSDPPRRAFLDALIRFLIQKDLTTYEEWNDRLAELNRQIEDTDVTTTPTLSVAGKWLLPLAVAVPFGMKFLGHDWLVALGKRDASLFERIAFPLGIILTGLPIAASIGLWFRWRTIRAPWRPEFWTKQNLHFHRQEYARESILSLFTNREVVKQKNRTVRTPDPSTIEFQKTFREILENVRVDKDGRRLRYIFVVDNLDRLPASQAVEMWSTIRSFFLGPEAGVSLPTVILPIDEAAVNRMYAAENGDPDVAAGLAESFMNKTFDLTFRVSRPVLSNWYNYIECKTAEIFGEAMRSDWPYIIASLYDAWLLKTEKTDPITPRQLNTLLNSIGTLWLQWGDSGVSFASIVYYAIDRQKIDAGILEYVTADQPLLSAQDAEWPSSLAAMHFGVPIREASQVLLSRPISQAISTNDAGLFKRLAETPGFFLAFDRILNDALLQVGINFGIRNAITLMNEVEVTAEAQRAAIWSKLRRIRARSLDGKTFSSVDARTFEILIERCEAAQLSTFVASSMAAFARFEDAAFVSPAGRDSIARTISAVLAAAAKGGTSISPITLKLSASNYLALLAAIGGEENAGSILRTGSSDEDLGSVVVTAINGSPSADTLLAALIRAGRKSDWSPILDAIDGQLRQELSPRTGASARALGAMRGVDLDRAQTRIDALVQDGSALSRFHEALEANDQSAAGSLAAVILVSNKPGTLVTSDNTSWKDAIAQRPQLASVMGEQLVNFGVDSLANFATIIEKVPTLADLLRASAAPYLRSGRLSLPSPKEIAENYGFYWLAVDHDQDLATVMSAARSEEFWAALEASAFEPSCVALGVLLCAEGEFRGRAGALAKARLDGLATELWAPAIKKGEFPYETAIEAREALSGKRLSGNLSEALRLHFSDLKRDDQKFRDRWFELLALTTDNSRKTLLRTLRDYLASQSDIKLPVALLKAGEGVFLKDGELSKAADGITRNLILPMLADNVDFAWLLTNANPLRPVVSGSTIETIGAIRERLEALSRVTASFADTERLGEVWGLPPFLMSPPIVEEDTDKPAEIVETEQ